MISWYSYHARQSAGAQDALPPSRAVLSQLPSGIVWLRAPVAPPKSGEMVTLAALEQPRSGVRIVTRDGDDVMMIR